MLGCVLYDSECCVSCAVLTYMMLYGYIIMRQHVMRNILKSGLFFERLIKYRRGGYTWSYDAYHIKVWMLGCVLYDSECCASCAVLTYMMLYGYVIMRQHVMRNILKSGLFFERLIKYCRGGYTWSYDAYHASKYECWDVCCMIPNVVYHVQCLPTWCYTVIS